MYRRLTTLLGALLLALALCAPAIAQEESEPTTEGEQGEVEATQTDDGSGSDGEVSAQDEEGDEASAEYSGPDQSRASNGRDDVNCEDFDFREDAEEFFEAGNREDEDRLDEDPGQDDNMPCETLPRRDDDDGTTPSGGVDSGAGGTAASDALVDALPAAVLGAVMTALLLGMRAVVRRRA